MNTLLLLLTTAQAASGGPAWADIYPPPRPSLCDRVRRCYSRFGLAVSGVSCTYGRRCASASNGPTPSYLRYFQGPPSPPAAAPAASPPAAGGAQESK